MKKKVSDKVIFVLKAAYYPAMALIVSLIIVSIIIWLMGNNPLTAYQVLITTTITSLYGWGEICAKAVPLILAALSYAIAQKCGMINLGANGQMYMGGIAAILVATNFDNMPSFFHILLTLVAGTVAGSLYGMLAGFFKTKFGASEVVTTMMLNYIALYFCTYLISGPIKDPAGDLAQSEQALDSAQLPMLVGGTRLNSSIILAALALLFYFFFIFRSCKGYEFRVVGLNSTAARYSGINIYADKLLSMAIAGAMAGLGGAIQASVIDIKLTMGWVGNMGFDGLAVSCLAGGTPVGIAVSAIFFGILLSGAGKMEMLAHVPSSVIQMFQGIVIIFIIGRKIFQFNFGKRLKLRSSRKQKEKEMGQ